MKRVYYRGAVRNEADPIWADDWNFDDEVAYRIEHHLSMHHGRKMEEEQQ